MEENTCTIWIDWVNKIITFRQTPGFKKRVYPSHHEMIADAMEKCARGFAIQ